MREQLIQEANDTVQGSIFKVWKVRKEYVDANIQSRLNAAISAWSQEKDAFETWISSCELPVERDLHENILCKVQ